MGGVSREVRRYLSTDPALAPSPARPPVADQLLQHKEHKIDIEDCRMRVQIQPLELPVVTNIQVTEQQGPFPCYGWVGFSSWVIWMSGSSAVSC